MKAKFINEVKNQSSTVNHDALRELERRIADMDNPNIVEPLKKQFNMEGYKSGYCDGFRAAIAYIKSNKKT